MAFAKKLKQWFEADRCDKDAYIITWRGKPITTILYSFKKAKERAGITRRLRPYDFRHSFATRLLANNEDPKAVSEIIGHSNVQTTLTIYNHVTAKKHKAAIERMTALDFEDLSN